MGFLCKGWMHRQISASEDLNCATLQELTGEHGGLFENRIQMLEGFGHGKRVEVAPALLAVLQNAAQIMPCDFHCQRIGDGVAGLSLMLGPRGKSQSDPNRAPVDEKLHVHGIGVAGCNRQHDALKDTTDWSAGPTLDSAEIFIHTD
jgi:hypothetical protein